MDHKLTQERDYLEDRLPSVKSDPFEQFSAWMEIAEKKITGNLYNAMVLSTCVDGQPTSRIVLLKEFTDQGFIFYTNYLSAKGKQIAENPKVSLLLWWDSLERQIRIEGIAEKIAAEQSDEYFHSRDKTYQMG